MNQTRTRRALLALGASAVALTGFDMAWAADAPARFTLVFDAVDCVSFPPVEILRQVKLLP